MKIILAILIGVFAIGSANAIIPYNKTEKKTKGEVLLEKPKETNNKFLTNKDLKKAVGVWTFVPTTHLAPGFTLVIKQYIPEKGPLDTLLYDVYVNELLTDENQIAFVYDHVVFITISYLTGHSHIAIPLNKGINKAFYSEFFTQTNDCETTGRVDNDGFDIYECIYYTGQLDHDVLQGNGTKE